MYTLQYRDTAAMFSRRDIVRQNRSLAIGNKVNGFLYFMGSTAIVSVLILIINLIG